jgi:hypothetical protein
MAGCGFSAHRLRTQSVINNGLGGRGCDSIAIRKSSGVDAWKTSSGQVRSIDISCNTIRGTELWNITNAGSSKNVWLNVL